MLRFLRPRRQWFNTGPVSLLIFFIVYWYASHQTSLDKNEFEGLEVNYAPPLAADIAAAVANVPEAPVDSMAAAEPLQAKTAADSMDKATWMAIQEERKKAVKEVCKGIPKDVLLQTLLTTKSSRDQLLVDDEHNAIYCYIPKVASFNWRKAWMVMTGAAKLKDIGYLSPMTVRKAFETKTLKYTEDVGSLKLKLKYYKKFIVVRHPLERLLSVYWDEVQLWKSLSPLVLRTVRKSRPTAIMSDIKWPEFVDFVVKEGVIDSRFLLPYEDLCHPCAIDYDVIAKFDTFKIDSEQFLNSINVTIKIPEPTPDNPRVNSTVLDSYLKQLTETQIMALRRKYHRDFLLFQYD